MARLPKPHEEECGEEQIKARMEQALKRALTTPHQTDKEMVERRRRQGMRSNPRARKAPDTTR